MDGVTYEAEVDTGAAANFITQDLWHELGAPSLKKTRTQYASASQHEMPILGEFMGKASSPVAKRE
ncbi:aspartyl protease family protein, partial [Klebsiella pneumoniae]|uniref:aspartyl protease family protein n=1 Tax=Klebsiella pneumoniae TaxID=573 RepID=UPI003EC02B7F